MIFPLFIAYAYMLKNRKPCTVMSIVGICYVQVRSLDRLYDIFIVESTMRR